MDIWIYGAGKRCGHLTEKLQSYPEIHVLGIADSFVREERFGLQVVDLLHGDASNCPKDSIIVITFAKLKDAIGVAKKLYARGFNNLYLYLAKTKSFNGFLDGECKKLPEDLDNVLLSLEMHVVDYCNLNCAGCVHFSPCFPKENPEFDVRIKDLEMMRRLFPRIIQLSLLGGEPLLSPDLLRYIEKSRELFPNAYIQLITNGLLLPKMTSDFFTLVREAHITIVISEYKPTSKILSAITDRLAREKTEYTVRGLQNKSVFNRSLSIRKDSVHEKYCLSNGCTAISDGYIARCPTLLYINRFNTFFKENLPSEGIYKIADFHNGKELKKRMEEKVPLCQYCVRDEMPWHICGTDISLEDFASLD